MKKVFIITMLLFSFTAVAEGHFLAVLDNDGATLTINIDDDHLIPPFEAQELWKVIKGNKQNKLIPVKEFTVFCNVLKLPTDEARGNCKLSIATSNMAKIGKYLVFKAQGAQAAKLNYYFIDSAYYSAQGNQVYLSSYNNRRQFYFGINEDLIQK